MSLAIGSRPRAVIRAGAAVVLAAMAVLAAVPAAGAPARPLEPSDGALVDSLRPTFRWTWSGSASQTLRFEVHVEGVGVVATSGGDTARPDADLPDDRELRWWVRRVPAGGGDVEDTPESQHGRFVTPPAPPLITEGPAGPTSDAEPAFAWTGSSAGSRWYLLTGRGTAVARGAERAGSGRIRLGPLAEGEYVFRAEQIGRTGFAGPPAERRFAVDVTPPAPPLIAGTPTVGAPVTWTGVEPGATCEWRAIAADGRVVAGPWAAATWSASLPELPAGSYVFQVRQLDAAGNAGEWASVPFTVGPPPSLAPPPTAPAVGTPRLRLPAERARALRPRAGARVAVRRPVLRWARGPRLSRVYNVQIFRVRPDGSLRKVFSGFPARRSLRVPPRRLAFGACYVWRVWPFLAGRRFATRPVGVSHFCVAPRGARAR